MEAEGDTTTEVGRVTTETRDQSILEGSQALLEYRWPPETRKSKKTNFLPELPERTGSLQSNFWVIS